MQLNPSAHVDTFCRDNLPPQDRWPEFRFDLPDLIYPVHLNCGTELLDKTLRRLGAERPCLLAPGAEPWSYGDLLMRANQVAQVLVEEFGVVPGNRVLLRGPNNPWLVACWFGVLKAGGVVVTTMPLLRPGELATVHEIARIDVAICDWRFTEDLRAAGLGVEIVEYGGSGAGDLTRRAATHPGLYSDVRTAADDVALLAFTSGTTGRPKATMHFHRDVLANADTFSRHVLKPYAADVFTGTPPLAFTFGLGGLVVFPLHVGAATLLIEKATPGELADLIETYGVTICFTAPTAYRAMLAGGHAGRLTSLRRAVSAGEHLPAATWQAFNDATGVSIIDGIGSTEMLHIFISAADDDIRPGSTGRPVPGYIATVVDDLGEPLRTGEVGRLAVKGPTGCRYLADARQSVYVQNGWNITGDTFRCDEDGYFWYQARSDDMIISSGYNIAGPEVEEALLAHPAVAECAVVGVPDEARGMVVKAVVVLADGSPPSDVMARNLQDFVKQRIAPYKYPRVIEFADALPRTSTGKLQRFRLRPDPPVPGVSPAGVVVAPDKFKGSLTAAEAAERIAVGIRRTRPDVSVRLVPVADGGDGTVVAVAAAGFTTVPVVVAGPTGRPVDAVLARRGGLAVVELAEASGLRRLPGGRPEPLLASSRGAGELVRTALDLGCRQIVLGVGGSASTDGGAGLLRALGARLLGSSGREVSDGGVGLLDVRSVDLRGLDPRLAGTTVILASDVDNPLLGSRGAAAVYAPQKGARSADLATLERGLSAWRDVVVAATGADESHSAGAGAAGGVGFAALSLLGASMRSGIEVVLELVGFDDALGEARLVVTGEGSLDGQSLAGKAPVGVAAAARRLGVGTIALVGRCEMSSAQIRQAGLLAAYSLTHLEPDAAISMRDAGPLLTELATRVVDRHLPPEPHTPGSGG